MNFENSISKNLTMTDKGTIAIHRIKKPNDGLIRIRQSEFAKKMAEEFYNESGDLIVKTKSETLSDIEDKAKKKDKKVKKHKKGKKNKKKSKKLKKAKQKKINACSEQLDTSSRKANVGRLLSGILENSIEIRVVKNKVYLYNEDTGLFSLSDKQEITTKINSWIDRERDDSYKFTSRDTDEAYKCLITNASIQMESLESAYNKPYVLCQNGVLELPSMQLRSFSPKYEFTSGLKASYDEKSDGKYFKEFIDYATYGDKQLQHLIQEIMGYVLSNYCNKRTAFVFKGVSRTGKSTILDVVRQLIGQEVTCEVPLNQMEHEYYAATVLSSKLNIVPDHNDKVIKDVARFKSFVSDTDVISGRNPCERPFAERCRTKMLFGSNHFFRFSEVTEGDLEAFFDRLLFIPFDRKIEHRIDSFWELLSSEYDYICTWSLKGLKRLIENDFRFTRSTASEEMKALAMAQCCPEESFFKLCLKQVEENRFESTTTIIESFKYFCQNNRITGNFNIIGYLERQNFIKTRKRIDDSGVSMSHGNAKHVIQGIRVRNKYRPE